MSILEQADVALVVEDDDALREVIEELLKMEGYLVLGRDSIGGARAILASVRPDVLVLDFNLRGELGTELLEELSTWPDAPPTLLVSASTLAAEAAERFGIELVKKPFDANDLVHRIQASMERGSRPTTPSQRMRATT